MKNLVPVGFGCGLGLAFGLVVGIPSGPPDAHGEAERNPCTDMPGTVRALVAERDRALIAGDGAGLAKLTETGSQVRGTDTALLAAMEGREIVELVTSVRSTTVIECSTSGSHAAIEVWTAQDVLEIRGEEPVGALPARCSLWSLSGQPWRLSGVGECEMSENDEGREY